LESLTKQEASDFKVIVLTAAVNPKLEEEAEAKVAQLITPFKASYPITQFAASDLVVLHRRMEELGLSEFVPLVSLRGYPNVRNIQLIIPHVLRAEVIVALDDDEVVEPDYLRKATEFIGQEYRGEFVGGVGGFYLNREGSKFLPEGELRGNIFLDKSAIMNEAVKALEAKPGRLVETPIAFGGNMVLHRRMFESVPFDPYISRGEDIDYVINARLRGFSFEPIRCTFFLDKELTITHLPPEAYGALPYSKLRQDVFRFIYEREKLRLAAGRDDMASISFESLDPHPGRFLREDVAEQALAALREVVTPELAERYGQPEEIIAQAERLSREEPARYFAFARAWPKLMAALGEDVTFRGYLEAKF
jgi:GT2 family glycosyltransferase